MDFWTDSWSEPRVDKTIYVIAGSDAEVRGGLTAARGIAAGTGRPVVLLVAHLVPYGTDLDACGHNLEQIGARFLPLAEAAGADVEVRVCACRETRHLFARMLVDGATVVVAGKRGRWWRSASERLAWRLECEGHRVTFVDVEAPTRREARAPASALLQAPFRRPSAPRAYREIRHLRQVR
jgi:hypothetical protein